MPSYTEGYHNAKGPDKRKDRRMPLPVFVVTIDGNRAETLNWSLTGLLIGGYTGGRKVGEKVSIKLLGEEEDTQMRVDIDAKVVRRGANGQLAVRFERLSPPIYDFFERCFAARIKKR